MIFQWYNRETISTLGQSYMYVLHYSRQWCKLRPWRKSQVNPTRLYWCLRPFPFWEFIFFHIRVGQARFPRQYRLSRAAGGRLQSSSPRDVLSSLFSCATSFRLQWYASFFEFADYCFTFHRPLQLHHPASIRLAPFAALRSEREC